MSRARIALLIIVFAVVVIFLSQGGCIRKKQDSEKQTSKDLISDDKEALKGVESIELEDSRKIESEGKDVELPTLQYIHTHKTGMLIKLPVEAACIIGEATEDETVKLLEYAELIGLAFQIKDDILDIEGDFEKIGKPVGSDEELSKTTYPQIFGMERTKEILAEKIERAKELAMEALGDENSKLFVELADFIGYRES